MMFHPYTSHTWNLSLFHCTEWKKLILGNWNGIWAQVSGTQCVSSFFMYMDRVEQVKRDKSNPSGIVHYVALTSLPLRSKGVKGNWKNSSSINLTNKNKASFHLLKDSCTYSNQINVWRWLQNLIFKYVSINGANQN